MMDQQTKLILAMYQVDNITKLIDGNEYQSYMALKLGSVYYELERQLSNLTVTQKKQSTERHGGDMDALWFDYWHKLMSNKVFTIRQLDLMCDALSSYLMEVDSFQDENVKDEVFDIIEMVGAYRMKRISSEYTEEKKPSDLSNVEYEDIEEYFDMNTGLTFNERVTVEDVTNSDKDWQDFWASEE